MLRQPVDKVREALFRWFGYIRRRDWLKHAGDEAATEKGGRPKRRFLDVLKEDMKCICEADEDAEDTVI